MVARTLFLGTPQFAVPSLEALAEDPRYDVLAVISQPDRPSGRGQKLTPPPVKVSAENIGIPVHQYLSLRKDLKALELLHRLNPDLCVVVAFGQILAPEFFDFPRYGTLNVHASLLPAYRGAAPIIHAVLNGETETGVTIMKIDAGMDTGDLLTTKAVALPPDMTAGDLSTLLSVEGAQLLVDTIDGYLAGEIEPVAQDNDLASYAPRLKKDDALINWRSNAAEIHNQIRAFNPWPVAFFWWKNRKVKVWDAEVVIDSCDQQQDLGEVISIRGSQIVVRCGDSTCMGLKELQLPNRKRVLADEFANGCQLEVGEIFA